MKVIGSSEGGSPAVRVVALRARRSGERSRLRIGLLQLSSIEGAPNQVVPQRDRLELNRQGITFPFGNVTAIIRRYRQYIPVREYPLAFRDNRS